MNQVQLNIYFSVIINLLFIYSGGQSSCICKDTLQSSQGQFSISRWKQNDQALIQSPFCMKKIAFPRKERKKSKDSTGKIVDPNV